MYAHFLAAPLWHSNFRLRTGTAPGPSADLLAEEGAAKEGVQAAKGSTREKLQQALRKLSMVQAQLEAAKGDQQDYPLSPGFFSNGIFF